MTFSPRSAALIEQLLPYHNTFWSRRAPKRRGWAFGQTAWRPKHLRPSAGTLFYCPSKKPSLGKDHVKEATTRHRQAVPIDPGEILQTIFW